MGDLFLYYFFLFGMKLKGVVVHANGFGLEENPFRLEHDTPHGIRVVGSWPQEQDGKILPAKRSTVKLIVVDILLLTIFFRVGILIVFIFENYL
jgi:hypothetical protein